MKIVINTCWGGFTLSKEATELYKQKTNTININIKIEYTLKLKLLLTNSVNL
jgi:hypothetical protein